MKLNSDSVWAISLIGTAVLFFYLGSIIGSSRIERDLSQNILDREERIKVLHRENQQLADQLTSKGIYSYPRAGIISGNQKDNLTLLIMLNGQEAIKDLVVKRNIISNYSNITDAEAEKNAPPKRSAYLGSLRPHTPAEIDVSLNNKEAAIEFIFESGNNKWIQTIRARRTPSGSILTFWVITNGNDLVIDKHIDQGFPVEEDGSILLWKDIKVNYSDIKMNSTLKI